MAQEDALRRELDDLARQVSELTERLENEPLRQLALSTKLDDVAQRVHELTGVLDDLRPGALDTDQLFEPVVQALGELRGELGTLRPAVPAVDPAHQERFDSAERLARAMRFAPDDPSGDFKPFPAVANMPPRTRGARPVVLLKGQERPMVAIYGEFLEPADLVTVDGNPVRITQRSSEYLLVEEDPGGGDLRVGARLRVHDVDGNVVINRQIEQ